MKDNWRSALVDSQATMEIAAEVLTNSSMRIVLVVDKHDCLLGTVTDGDIRRSLERGANNIFNQTAEFLMSKDPISIASNALAIAALEIMEEHNITSLFVYSSPGLSKPDGIVHIHDILKTGVQ